MARAAFAMHDVHIHCSALSSDGDVQYDQVPSLQIGRTADHLVIRPGCNTAFPLDLQGIIRARGILRPRSSRHHIHCSLFWL